MPESAPEPTPAQAEQTIAIHLELVEVMNRQAREGFPVEIIMAGLAAAAADLITCTIGLDQVPRWFASQAITADALLRDAG